jgi:hypothetical protein
MYHNDEGLYFCLPVLSILGVMPVSGVETNLCRKYKKQRESRRGGQR